MKLTSSGTGVKKLSFVRVGKLPTVLLLIYFILSFYEGYTNQIVGSYTKYYLLLIITIFLLNYRKIKIDTYHWLFLFWLCFKCISLIWGLDSSGSATVFTHLLSQLGMVCFLITMTIVKFDHRFLRKLIDVSLYASASLGLLGIFFSEAYHFSVSSRQVLTIFGYQIDPNNLAALYLVGFALALYYAIFEEEHIVRNLVFAGICGISLGLTGSRGGFVSLIFVVVCLIVLTSKDSKKSDRFKKLAYVVTTSIIIYIISVQFIPGESLARLLSFEQYGYGSGRDELWSAAITLFLEKPFFGWGWGGYEAGIHNTYLSMLCDIGLIGTMLFLIPLIIICMRALKAGVPIAIIILVSGLAPSFFLDAINKRFFWNAIVLAIMVLNSNQNHIRQVPSSIKKKLRLV